MASLTLDRDECAEGFLPPVCVRCGEAATGTRSQTFQWSPPILFLLFFVCTPLCILLFLLLRKRMTVALPLCDRHRGMWVRRQIAMVAGILSMVAGIWVGATFGREIDRLLHFDSTTPIAIFGGVMAGVLLVGIAGFGAIRATRITTDTITLKGVSPAFAETVEQYRILLEDDDG
jgi:hypothetical protein